jgi:hypothetical protein
MTQTKMYHQPHPADDRRTIGGHYRTACERWAGFAAFYQGATRVECPKCAVAVLVAHTSHDMAAR